MGKTVFSGSHKVLIDALTQERHKLGLNQTELGERLGRDQRFISLIESYQRRIDVVEFCIYAKALGLNPSDFLDSIIGSLDLPDRL